MAAPLALFVTRHSPRPQDDGASALLHEMMGFLTEHGVRCHVAWLEQPAEVANSWRWRTPAELASVCRLHFRRSVHVAGTHFFPERLPLGGRTARRLGSRLQPEPASPNEIVPFAGIPNGVPRWYRPLDQSELAFVARLVRRLRPNALLVNYPWLGSACTVANGATTIMLSHNVWHQKARSTAALLAPGSLDYLTARTESAMLSVADRVVAISDDDYAAYTELVPPERIILVPKAVTAEQAPGTENPDLCLYLGSHNPSNRAGLAWLLAEVWPRVLRDHPAARLRICGRVGEGLTGLDPSVENLGFIESPDVHYGASALVLVPLHHGGGVKIKLLEGLSHGKAVVTTSTGLQGLGFLSETLPPADTPVDFAAQIVALLRNPAARAARAKQGRDLALSRFSPERCYGPLLAAITGRPHAHAAR
ncbi:MAG TPA: glycosyltransferase family 4 protein [Opitutaceae bacterium]|nr:glycosyltransferase family 4 protein [Opitutaceae bacterium]